MRVLDGLIADLESAVQEGRQERRVEVLRKVTDLFLSGADRFNDEHVEVFGDVLTHLTKQVETKALAELGARLAPVENAPADIIQRLARHDEIAVAGPVLAQSARLSDSDLVEIAKSKGSAHLGAISDRKRLAEAVTDVLVERGDADVVRRLSSNAGAAFSRSGMGELAKRAESDAQLAENLGGRVDVPPEVLHDLIAKATEAVRARLIAVAPPENQARIQSVLAAASGAVERAVAAAAPRDFRAAEAWIAELKSLNQLNETTVANLARTGQYEEMTAGFASLCGASVAMIEPLMRSASHDGLLIACKAAGIHWQTLSAVLMYRHRGHPCSAMELETARAEFLKLSAGTAQRVFRFWCVRGGSKAAESGLH